MDYMTGLLFIRLLEALYHQIMTDNCAKSLFSLEKIISLVRYLTPPEKQIVTIEEESQIIQQLFLIFSKDDAHPFFTDYHQTDRHRTIPRASLLREICYHGIELFHFGRVLTGVIIRESDHHIIYQLIDSCGNTYGGTINDSPIVPTVE